MAVSKKVAVALEGRFTKVARVFARNHKINVRMVGTKCNTTEDGTINLPANADYLTDETADTLEGMLDHEWSHQSEESEARERKGYPSPLSVMKSAKDKREKLMLNVFEDIRIELKQAERYVGVADNLNSLQKHTAETILKPRILGKMKDPRTGTPVKVDPWWAIGCGIICKGRGFDTSWFPPVYQELMDLLKEEIEESKTTKDATECLALARRVIEKLKSAGEESEPEEGGDMSEEGEEGDEEGEHGEGAPKKDKKDKAGKSKQKGGTDPGEDGAEGGGEGEGEAEEGEDGEGSGKGSELSEEAKAEAKKLGSMDSTSGDLLDEAKEDLRIKAEYDITTHERHIPHPEIVPQDRVSRAERHSEGTFQTYLDEVRPQVSALRAKILTVLQSRKARRYIGDQERGGVDVGALYGLRLGNKRVFTTRTPDIDVDTVVGILVDQSGSMGSGDYGANKSHVARKAVIALSECLSKVNVPFAVWGFDNDGPDTRLVPSGSGMSTGSKGLYNRFSAMDIEVFKDFDENYNSIRTRLLGITGRGDNTDGEALQWCARAMHHRRESRKILMVLSDGMPACSYTDFNLLGKHLREVVLSTTDAGIEVFGIGIQTESVKQFYPDYTVVNDLNDLATNTFRMLKKYLLAKKPSQREVKARR